MSLISFRTKGEKQIIKDWERTGWGNNIYFDSWEEREIVGWLPILPKVGDELQCKMGSGKIARFEFIEVKPCNDPDDMFYAKVKDIGYLSRPKGEL